MATNTEKVVVQVIVKGGKDLDNLTKKTGDATKSTGGLTKGMAKMAGGILAAAAAFRKIGQVISGAIKSFTAFEFQMAKVKAISGASEKDFKKLSNTAQDLGRSTFFTAQQVAELQTNFAKLGFSTKEILNAQEATLLLATATGSDLGRAAVVAGAAVRGFRLDASETTRVVDVMTLAFNSSALDIEKWQTSMTKVAPIAAGMNIELEDTAAIMGTLTDAGIEASIAGTSMRNIFLKMKDSSSDLSKFLGFTVNSSVDLSEALKKLGTASDTTLDGLVNIRQVAAFSVMVRGAKRVEKLTEELRNAKGAAEEAASIIGDTLEGAFKRLTSASQGLAIKLTADLGGGLQDMIDGFANFINKLTDSSEAIANTVRALITLGKWIGAMALGIKLYAVASLGATTATGAFRRALVLARVASRAFTTSINISRVAMKKFLIGSGIGIVVVLLTELASAFIFSGDSAEDAAGKNDTYTESLKKQAAAQKQLDDINEKPLAKTREQGQLDLQNQNALIKSYEDVIEINKEKLKIVGLTSEEERKLNDTITRQSEALLELETKKLRIQKNNSQLRQNILKKNFDNDIKAEEKRNRDLIKEEKLKLLADEITKKQFNHNIEQLELIHLDRMISVKNKHKEDSIDLEEELLDLQIKIHTDKEEQTRSLIALAKEEMAILLKMPEETEEEITKKHELIDILQLEIDKLLALGRAKDKQVEKNKEIIEFNPYQSTLEDLDELIAKDKQAADERIANGERVLNAMTVTSDAIFSILNSNASRRATTDEKILEERKQAGLITEKEYEDGVEAIQRKAFERKKRMDIAQVVIDTALAIAKIQLNAAVMKSNPVTILFAGMSISQIGLAMATGAAQIAVIASQKFANGGMIEEFADGGMVNGKSHAQGGEKFAVGGRVVELEGGEAVINKRSTAMFSSQLSAMNSAGGGVKFADGGLLNQPSFSQQQFNALGQNQMMGAMGGSSKVVVVEADITDSQNTVSVIQSQATI